MLLVDNETSYSRLINPENINLGFRAGEKFMVWYRNLMKYSFNYAVDMNQKNKRRISEKII